MRKILFTLLFCGVTLVSYSQANISASIDSLQNEYNFLNCEFKLYTISNDLSGLGKDIDIRCNYIDIKRYHNRPDGYVNKYLRLLHFLEKTFRPDSQFALGRFVSVRGQIQPNKSLARMDITWEYSFLWRNPILRPEKRSFSQ